MANTTPSTPPKKRKREKLKGQCKIWIRMRDNRHDKALQLPSDYRKDMDLSKEIEQLKKAKIRIDNNPKYPGPVGMAIIYYYRSPNDVQGVPVATFDLDKGNSWKNH